MREVGRHRTNSTEFASSWAGISLPNHGRSRLKFESGPNSASRSKEITQLRENLLADAPFSAALGPYPQRPQRRSDFRSEMGAEGSDLDDATGPAWDPHLAGTRDTASASPSPSAPHLRAPQWPPKREQHRRAHRPARRRRPPQPHPRGGNFRRPPRRRRHRADPIPQRELPPTLAALRRRRPHGRRRRPRHHEPRPRQRGPPRRQYLPVLIRAPIAPRSAAATPVSGYRSPITINKQSTIKHRPYATRPPS